MKELKERKGLRLDAYDYSQPGACFVTICTKDQEKVFGEIKEGVLTLNKAGEMVTEAWNELPRRFPTIRLDEFVIMPNHVHGIIWLLDVGADLRVRPHIDIRGNGNNGPTPRSAPTLGRVIQWFKTMTTNYYIQGVQRYGWPRFPGRLWQRNYYERVVRNEQELFEIRQYIQENPLKWDLDPENLSRHDDRTQSVS